jgi:hypothetical protein
MEDTGALAASSTPAATSISAEIDSMFADASTSESSESSTESTESESTTTASAPNPQDSTVQPPAPEDFEPEDATPAPVEAKPTTTEVAEAPLEATPVPEDERGGEEYEQRGKKWIRYPEARGKEVFAGYQTAKTLQKELNLSEPVTAETARLLAVDKSILDGIDFDLMSKDPSIQSRAFQYLFKTAQKALDGEHTAHNPKETMADALLHAAATHAPEVIQGLEQRITSHTFDKLYRKAVAAGLDTEAGQHLLSSVQRADQALTGSYRKKSELTGTAQQTQPDPLAAQRQELAQRAASIEEKENAALKAHWDNWNRNTKVAVEGGLTDAIANVLKPVSDSLKNFPQTRKNVEIRLRSEVVDSLAKDQKFGIERDRCLQQATIAGSESVRESWRARLIQLYTSKAEQVLREKAPAILSESAQAVKARSDKTHERLKGTQQLRGTPAGGIAPNGAAAPSPSSGKFDSRTWAQEFEAAFN